MASKEPPGSDVQAARVAPDKAPGELYSEEEQPPAAPWHFKVLVVGTIGYLIYRAIWFGFWLTHHV